MSDTTLAEAVEAEILRLINRCDGIVTMDSDQRRACVEQMRMSMAAVLDCAHELSGTIRLTDDDRRIDPEFLAAQGFGKDCTMPFCGGELCIYPNYEGGGTWSATIEIENRGYGGCRHEISLPEPQTRGDWYRLRDALGIAAVA